MPWNEVTTLTLRHEFVMLAELEGCKFGPRSFRRAYLLAISRTLDAADRLTPVVARPLKRLTYVVINSLSYLTVYRLPSI